MQHKIIIPRVVHSIENVLFLLFLLLPQCFCRSLPQLLSLSPDCTSGTKKREREIFINKNGGNLIDWFNSFVAMWSTRYIFLFFSYLVLWYRELLSLSFKILHLKKAVEWINQNIVVATKATKRMSSIIWTILEMIRTLLKILEGSIMVEMNQTRRNKFLSVIIKYCLMIFKHGKNFMKLKESWWT